MAELDDVKKAAIAAAISAYLASGASGTAAFRPTMFLRQVKGAGAWEDYPIFRRPAATGLSAGQ